MKLKTPVKVKNAWIPLDNVIFGEEDVLAICVAGGNPDFSLDIDEYGTVRVVIVDTHKKGASPVVFNPYECKLQVRCIDDQVPSKLTFTKSTLRVVHGKGTSSLAVIDRVENCSEFLNNLQKKLARIEVMSKISGEEFHYV